MARRLTLSFQLPQIQLEISISLLRYHDLCALRMLFLSLGLIGICLVSRVVGSSIRSGVSSAPELDDADTIQFFVMESSFPFNTPQNIRLGLIQVLS